MVNLYSENKESGHFKEVRGKISYTIAHILCLSTYIL